MNRDFEFLIVGGGIAGLRAAIALAPAGRVAVLTKSDPDESNTGYAQGGIAAAVGVDDSTSLHATDTIQAGDGLCDQAAVRVLVEDGPVYVRELLEWGTRFDRGEDGQPALGREAAHSVRRVLHAGDATGREIGRTLWRRVSSLSSVQTINHVLVTELVLDHGRVAGVVCFDAAGARLEFRADATLLATGGAGQVFSNTTNPVVATGDGISLAYRVGARVADLEFIQFHPTALKIPGAPRFLISEALRGEGARLVNRDGDAFMARYHPGGDLAPRDVVARSIVREEDRTGGRVCLTLAHLDPEFVTRRFPTIADMCRRVGLDLARDPIPVGPAAHYIMGGVETDVWGRTSVPGLFAAGEVACTGVHGANRLASNSLLEGLVFGARAGQAMTEPAAEAVMPADRVEAKRLSSRAAPRRPWPSSSPNPLPTTSEAVQSAMWQFAGLFRTGEGLRDVAARLEEVSVPPSAPVSPDASRQLHLLTVARLIARAALRREESRGGHFRADFPERDDQHWKIHIVDRLADD